MATTTAQHPVLTGLTLMALYALWEQLGDIPVFPERTPDFEMDSIEEPFLHFAVGTPREDIWRWFESQNAKFIVGDVMQGIRHCD